MRYTQALIDLKAIRSNLATIHKSILKPEQTGIIAVVKANAYGHGLVEIARTAAAWGASHLAVAITDEGVTLREHKIQAPIIVLGLIASGEAAACVENNLIVTVCAAEHLAPLAAAARKSGVQAKVMLKVDTGMNRIGVAPEQAVALARAIIAMPELEFYGMFTHFASAGGPDLGYAKAQEEKFRQLVQAMTELGLRPPFVSASASGAALTMPDSQYDLVRAGISMYGLYPSSYLQGRQKLVPAMTLKTNITYLKNLPAGSAVGYEMTYRTTAAGLIATLPVGYGDGYNRRLSNQARVLINGNFYPVCGNICMDQMMVCLGADAQVAVGEEVVLVGSQGENSISFEQLAQTVGTINYELACNIAQRVPRVYSN